MAENLPFRRCFSFVKTASERITEMYVKKDTLSERINLHAKYSVNKYGWANWVFDKYALHSGMKVLELACGTAEIWNGRILPDDIKITLSDFSPLMVDKAKNLLGGNPVFDFSQIDIQSIPFEDNTFDAVIANHMLYHVPDMKKALSEVKRVLRKNGHFYATTIGINSLRELQDIYKKIDMDKTLFSYSENISFTLQNGNGILENYFSSVERDLYIDSLEVTSAEDLMTYILSYNKIPDDLIPELHGLLEKGFNKDGIFNISKEQGIFISIK